MEVWTLSKGWAKIRLFSFTAVQQPTQLPLRMLQLLQPGVEQIRACAEG